jgi:hypothetical protein
MKNKKLIYGLLVVGAIAGVYFWDKNKKKKPCSCSSAVKPQGTATSENYSNVAGGGAYGLGCRVCQRKNGSTYFAQGGLCAGDDTCFASKRNLNSI